MSARRRRRKRPVSLSRSHPKGRPNEDEQTTLTCSKYSKETQQKMKKKGPSHDVGFHCHRLGILVESTCLHLTTLFFVVSCCRVTLAAASFFFLFFTLFSLSSFDGNGRESGPCRGSLYFRTPKCHRNISTRDEKRERERKREAVNWI